MADGEESDDGFPLHEQVRLDLQRLAHVEFFTNECDKDWRVAPPALAITQQGDRFLGILCGARSDGLVDRFRMAAGGANFVTEETPVGLAALMGSSGRECDLVELAGRTRIAVQKDAPLAILSSLPVTRLPRRADRTQEFPEGNDWLIHDFDSEKRRWNKVERREARLKRTGLFRFTIHFQPARYFLKWDSLTYEVPRAVGIYSLLRKRRQRVLEYDRERQSLKVPGVCRPMLLVERALVLCSGITPEFDPRDSKLTYRQVPEEIALLTGQILIQDIR
jgi:hypothetical protein